MAERSEYTNNRRYPRSHQSRPGQNRIYHHLGVRDLREIIDRKRNERGYNSESDANPLDNSESPAPNNQVHTNKKKNSVKTDRENSNTTDHLQDIESPLNIKVEFSTLTGEHSYQVDENTVLPTIKHVPDCGFTHQRRGFRGRGRGRGRGQRGYHTRHIRNRNRTSDSQPGATDISVEISKTDENWDNETTDESNVHCDEETEPKEEETLTKLENLKIDTQE